MMRPVALACALTCALAALGAAAPAVLAAPSGGSVVAGSATIRSNGTQTDIVQTTPRAVIDWRRFDVGPGESVHFRQPDASASTLNRVTGGEASRILGTVTATGQVVLLNPNGVLIGRDARIDTGGLVVGTARLATQDFMAGRLVFDASEGVGGSVVNEGTVTVRDGGLAALVAPHVRNDGVIRADLGRVVLASGSAFAIDLAGDGLVSLAVREADLRSLVDVHGRPVAALVEHTGSTVAQGGRVVVMTPAFASRLVDHAIHLGGTVRADAVARDRGGAIVLTTVDGAVALAGEVAAPGGTFTLRRTGTAALSLDAAAGEALGRVLRSGTDVAVEAAGHLDVAARRDGRGGAAGARLRLQGSSVGLRHDLATADGTVAVTATAGALTMAWPAGGVAPGRAWPMIAAGGAAIDLRAGGDVTASHLVTRGPVSIESARGNVRIVSSLGHDAGGTSPLASLTVRALGATVGVETGNVHEIYDVAVAAGGRIDIAAAANIQLYARADARTGLVAARQGLDGRTLRLASDRLGGGDLATEAYYWTGLNSRVRHAARGSSPVDAAGRWTDLRLTAKATANPTLTAPPGPTNGLAPASVAGGGLGVLGPPAARPAIPDLLPGASTVVAAGGGDAGPDAAALAVAAASAETAQDGFSANRGVAQLADTGRSRSTVAPKDVFSLADHVVEVPVCGIAGLGADPYFARATFGRPLNTGCR